MTPDPAFVWRQVVLRRIMAHSLVLKEPWHQRALGGCRSLRFKTVSARHRFLARSLSCVFWQGHGECA